MQYSIIVINFMSVGKIPRAITKQEAYQIIKDKLDVDIHPSGWAETACLPLRIESYKSALKIVLLFIYSYDFV